jgi:hypothetical protein
MRQLSAVVIERAALSCNDQGRLPCEALNPPPDETATPSVAKQMNEDTGSPWFKAAVNSS